MIDSNFELIAQFIGVAGGGMGKQLSLFSSSSTRLLQRFVDALTGAVYAEFCCLLQDVFYVN